MFEIMKIIITMAKKDAINLYALTEKDTLRKHEE